MSSYDVGDAPTVTTELRNAAGNLTNATVTFTLTAPDGTITTPTVTTTGTGLYEATFTVDQVGTWLYKWTASSGVNAVEGGQLSVYAQRALVASMAELKKQLNRTDTSDDDELRTYLEAATDFVEWAIGGPVGPQTFTERAAAVNGLLVLARQPVVSVTSVTPVTNGVLGTAIGSTLYRIDDRSRVVQLFSQSSAEYEVVYRAGLASIFAGVKLAGLIIAQHLWSTQQNPGGGRPVLGEEGQVMMPGAAFAIPYRAADLLKPYMLPGVA